MGTIKVNLDTGGEMFICYFDYDKTGFPESSEEARKEKMLDAFCFGHEG